MPNKVDRIRRLRAAVEAIAQGTEQPTAGQITGGYRHRQLSCGEPSERSRRPEGGDAPTVTTSCLPLPGSPMTLGNMRALDVRSLAVTCELCRS